MGLLSSLWKRGGVKSQEDATVERVKKVSQDPQRWSGLDLKSLNYLLYYEVLNNAVQPDPARFERLFSLTNRKLPASDRMELVQMISKTSEEGDTNWVALLPFVYFDSDWQVVATASLDAALLGENEEGESLSGPRRLIQLARNMDNEERAATVLGGLLSTGDRRVTELVFPELSHLGVMAGQRLSRVGMMSAYAAVIDLYADWIELLVDGKAQDEDGALLGSVCGTLAAVPERSMPPQVVEVKRAFPVTPQTARYGVVVVRTWEFEEYHSILKQRLLPVALREPEPGAIELALDQWPSI